MPVLDRWRCVEGIGGEPPELDLERYHRLTIDLYIPAADVGFWQGVDRDPRSRSSCACPRDTILARKGLMIDVQYGDHEGGQRTVSRFVLNPIDSGEWTCQVVRHWNVDRPNPDECVTRLPLEDDRGAWAR